LLFINNYWIPDILEYFLKHTKPLQPMTENNFTQLPEEEPQDPNTLDDISLGIQSHLDSSRSIATVFEFFIVKMRSFVVAYLGGKEN